jgi:hypothetical protein
MHAAKGLLCGLGHERVLGFEMAIEAAVLGLPPA